MKRKLALFLALVMILSLVPANVFATSDNDVNKVPSVTDEKVFTLSDAPVLTIEEDEAGEFGTTETFRLELTNADWAVSAASMTAGYGTTETFPGAVTYTQLSDTIMEVQLVGTDNSGPYKITVQMLTEVDAEGVVKVTVNGMDSAVTDGTYTFANAGGGDTATSIDDTVDFADGDIVTIEDILIDELAIGTITSGALIKLKLLDGDFEWAESALTTSFTFGGGLSSASVVAATATDRVMEIQLSTFTAATARGSITLKDFRVDADKDANVGEVEVKIYGDDVTEETFVVANYVDYTVTIEADDDEEDLPEIYAGTKTEEVSNIIIEEQVFGALLENRSFDLGFEDWVQIVSVNFVDSDGLTGLNNTAVQAWYDTGDNSLEIDGLVRASGDTPIMIELEVIVSVEADAKGDIIATASGKALGGETMEVKVATALAPVTVEIVIADVKVGLQDQAVGKIVITEAEEGILETGTTLSLVLDDNYFDFTGTPDIEVTKGDIEVDVDTDDQMIIIEIDDESTDISTFEITGILVDLNRSVPEGVFLIGVGGPAIVFNNGDLDEDFGTDYVVEQDYIRVITPADTDVKVQEDVVFTIDAMTFTVGETVVNMDAAPFIDASNRTMLPLRAFANALNVSDTNILWNGVERSVTIFKGDRVVKVVVGEMSYMVNGVSVPMDTAVVIKDSRTFLPVRALGNALGADISWDAATRSVTIK